MYFSFQAADSIAMAKHEKKISLLRKKINEKLKIGRKLTYLYSVYLLNLIRF
jgi:hypothetical protein